MTQPFHANLRLISGEELLAEVLPTEECGEEVVVLNNPILITEATGMVTTKKEL